MMKKTLSFFFCFLSRTNNVDDGRDVAAQGRVRDAAGAVGRRQDDDDEHPGHHRQAHRRHHRYSPPPPALLLSFAPHHHQPPALSLKGPLQELLGTPITAKSDDNFLAMLRLEKIGTRTTAHAPPHTHGGDMARHGTARAARRGEGSHASARRVRVPDVQPAGHHVGLRERGAAHDHPRQALRQAVQEAHPRPSRPYSLPPPPPPPPTNTLRTTAHARTHTHPPHYNTHARTHTHTTSVFGWPLQLNHPPPASS